VLRRDTVLFKEFFKIKSASEQDSPFIDIPPRLPARGFDYYFTDARLLKSGSGGEQIDSNHRLI